MFVQLGFLFSNSEAGGDSSGLGWSQVIAFGVVILIMALMPRIIKRIRNERKALTKQETNAIRNRPNIKNKADEILVELAEVSREINAQADTKIRILNKLVRDAEKAIKRYEELVEKDTISKKLVDDNSKKVKVDHSSNVDKAEIKIDVSDSKSIKKRATNSLKDNIVAEKVDNSKNNFETGVWQKSIGLKILELSKKGYDINEIALKTRMSVSEITLMLEMLKKSK